ncbi:MAG: energy transducer TonB [Deltaproteobacteria bacterium]|nr:MAG: energy transducer TonB [Deltaproteobacteria bacterium]
MKKYFPFLISLTFHLLIFLPWIFWKSGHQPLPGGGGGTGSGGDVSIDIMGDIVGHSQKISESESIDTKGDIPLLKSQKKTSKNSNQNSGSIQGPIGPGTGSGQGSGSGEGTGQDATLALIRSRIEHAKRYPELAKNAGISGSVLVSFQINENGQAAGLTIKESSNSSLLDDEARATITRAQPFPLYADPLEIRVKFEQVSD